MSVFCAVFAQHFATCAGKSEELREVERFANQHLIVNAAGPNEHMIELDLERRGALQ
jgi:hypothetical protein